MKLSRSNIGLAIGTVVFFLMLVLPPPEGMTPEGWRVAAVGLLMAVWWITEAIPIPATALLPLALFPLLGAASMGDAASPYANPLIFLFLGGFMIALAMERWELHRRIALTLVSWLGTRPDALVGGFMLATGGLSMWVSNTATTVVMLPIGLSIIRLTEERVRGGMGSGFAPALLLGIAYGASIGGLATLIGTPPNALLAGFLQTSYGITLGFAEWMSVGLPLTIVMMIVAWLVLTRLSFQVGHHPIEGARQILNDELHKLGPISTAERRVGIVFALVAILWLTRPFIADFLPVADLNDTVIAIGGALALFLLPAGTPERHRLLDWETARRVPWGVLLLFGGGLSLAGAVQATGLAEWIAESMEALGGLPVVVVVLAVTAVILLLTEMTSNTATAAAFLPLVAGLAIAVGENPYLLVVPAAVAASCAFMLPVATPPNAIVFGSGHLTIGQMMRAGIWLNLTGIALITLWTLTLLPVVFGIELGEVPDWARGVNVSP